MTPHPRRLHAVLCAVLLLTVGAEPHRKPPTSPTPSVSPPAAIDPAARSAGANASWWQTVSAQIAREEYHVTPTPAGLQAPNRAHGLRTYFRSGGIEVVPRQPPSAGSASWRFAWSTTRWGRPDHMQTVGLTVPQPQAEGARVIYAHPGLDEWYENKPEGLERASRCTPGRPGRVGSVSRAGSRAHSAPS